MTAPQPQFDSHSQLASALGTQFAQQLFRVLPEHAKALGPDAQEKTKFTTVVEFINGPEGLDVVVVFKNSIPLQGLRVKIGWLEDGSQLSLLPEPPPVVPQAPAPPPPPAPPTAMDQRAADLAARTQPAPAPTGAFLGRRPDPDEAGVS